MRKRPLSLVVYLHEAICVKTPSRRSPQSFDPPGAYTESLLDGTIARCWNE